VCQQTPPPKPYREQADSGPQITHQQLRWRKIHMTTTYYQCRMRLGASETIGWIEERVLGDLPSTFEVYAKICSSLLAARAAEPNPIGLAWRQKSDLSSTP
jgi:hypothetical protein